MLRPHLFALTLVSLGAAAVFGCGQKRNPGGPGEQATAPASVNPNTATNPNSAGNPNVSGNPNATAATTVGFAAQAGPIIKASCTPCHAGAQAPLLDNYSRSKVGFSTGGGLSDVQAGTMPPAGSKFSAADKATLIAWAAGGYQP